MPIADAVMSTAGGASSAAIASASRRVPSTRLSRIFRFCSAVHR
jgi:hypothetical protein